MKITKDMKIEALERIVKAVFGMVEGKIGYRKNFKDMLEVTVECDVDDAVKLLDNLNMGEIDHWFYVAERKIDPKYSKLRNCNYEGYTEITLTLETQYWKRVKELEKELSELKSKKFK